MQVSGGKAFWPLDPIADEIEFTTIAAALSKICRYGGHTTEFYSVAEHCVRVSDWLMAQYGDPELALKGLIHDGAEAYIGDMVRPLKYSIPMFKEVEDRILALIHRKLDLDFNGDLCSAVKEADNRILLDERAKFLADSPYLWFQDITGERPLGIEFGVEAWGPALAEDNWMIRFEELTS